MRTQEIEKIKEEKKYTNRVGSLTWNGGYTGDGGAQPHELDLVWIPDPVLTACVPLDSDV